MSNSDFTLSDRYNPRSQQRWDADIDLPAPRSNRPVTFVNRLEAVAMDSLYFIVRVMGIDFSSALIGKTLRLIGPKLKSVQKKGMRNLRMVFPENSEEENQQILADVWENLGRLGAEMVHLDKMRPLEENSRVTVEGLEILQRLNATGRPVIYFSGHFANWEVMAPTLFRAEVRAALIYRAYNNPLLDDRIIKLRARVMSRLQIPKGIEGSREVIRVLKEKYALCLMMDQKLNTGISVPFMGHDAMTAPASARMALKFKAPLVPLQIVREKGAHFRFICHEPIEIEPSGDSSADVYKLTSLMNEKLEDMVRENPGQWLWFHQRWPKDVTRGR